VESEDLTVLIPTLNEEKNIGRLIETIADLMPRTTILVIDDGSTDMTQDIVKSKSDKAELLDRSDEHIKGLSASIKDGINQTDTSYFMVIDGDFQHPPDSLLEAVTCVKKEPELIIGYRIKVEKWPILRKIISWGAQKLAYMSLLLRRRQRPRDIMSGFFGGKTNTIRELINNNKITPEGYKILFDILKVFPKNGTICQFGYIFKNREYGDSKIGRQHILAFIKSLFR